MNCARETPIKRYPLVPCVSGFAILLAFSALLGCNHASPPPTEDTPPQATTFDHVTPHAETPPQSVVHGTFSLGKFQKFAFDVPAHTVAPKVRGEFSSSTAAPDGSRVSDESADVELMVMTDAQFDDFVHRRSAESVEAIEPSHHHAVSISLPGTQADAAHYYVLFRRAAEGKTPISVKAEITAEFTGSD